MRTLLMCGAVLLMASLSGAAADPKELAGDWQAVAAERNGAEAKVHKWRRPLFQKRRLSSRTRGK